MGETRVEPDKRKSLLGCLMNFAFVIRARSTCKRLQVGSLIVTPDFEQVLAYGYNGNARGLLNCCDSEEPGLCGCVHAEINALIKSPSTKDMILISTHSPCMACAKCVINARLSTVYFQEWYRDAESTRMLANELKDGIWQYRTKTDDMLRIEGTYI